MSAFQNGYALLIGVGHSFFKPYSLPVTARDAQKLHSVLIDPGRCAYPPDHIRLLHDKSATREAILEQLKWLAERTAHDADATAIFFFSGHGWLANDGTYCLLPHDVHPADIAGSSITGSELTAALRAIKARRLLAILDCCHAGGMASAKDGLSGSMLPSGLQPVALPKGLAEELRQGAGRVILSSSLDSQQSWTRPDGVLSIYTHHLLEALQGAGSQEGETTVRISTLIKYLARMVSESAREINQEQTPFFAMEAEDFPVALLLGGKGVQAQGKNQRLKQQPLQNAVTQNFNNYDSNLGVQGIVHGSVVQVGEAHIENDGSTSHVTIADDNISRRGGRG